MGISVRNLLASILIISGLIIVFFDILSSYYYFTAQKEFPQVFASPTVSTTAQTQPSVLSAQEQVGNIIKNQLKELVPENTITQLLNMSSWIMFASFLLWAG
ncbi:MAG: hypothetical protein PHD31_01840, partial [Candidatus Pacebacteria bacterium]|nr:hypothetical protein [Candidatus Paceibacterota bacterium]